MTALDRELDTDTPAKEVPLKAQSNLQYVQPAISRAGSFKNSTRGSGPSLAFDFYLTDRD